MSQPPSYDDVLFQNAFKKINIPQTQFYRIKDLVCEISKNENEYNMMIYDILGQFTLYPELQSKIIEELENGVYGYDSCIYDEQKQEYTKYVDKMLTEPNIEEGVYVCRRCGNKRCAFNYAQTRRADEGMSVFIMCSNPKCRHTWSERG